MAKVRECPDCGGKVNTSEHKGHAWQIHRMQEALERPATCPCGYDGNRRGYMSHECEHHTRTLGGSRNKRQTATDAVPELALLPDLEDAPEPVPPVSESLLSIADSLRSLAARLQTIAERHQEHERAPADDLRARLRLLLDEAPVAE